MSSQCKLNRSYICCKKKESTYITYLTLLWSMDLWWGSSEMLSLEPFSQSDGKCILFEVSLPYILGLLLCLFPSEFQSLSGEVVAWFPQCISCPFPLSSLYFFLRMYSPCVFPTGYDCGSCLASKSSRFPWEAVDEVLCLTNGNLFHPPRFWTWFVFFSSRCP